MMELRKFAQSRVQVALKSQAYSSKMAPANGSSGVAKTKGIKTREAYVPRHIGVTSPWGVK